MKGNDQAVANRDPWSWNAAELLVRQYARSSQMFTSDIVADNGIVLDHPCRLGALFMHLHRAGILERVGYMPSRRAGRNGSVVAIWRGTDGQ